MTSHGLNVSTERLETFWTSHLGDSDWWHRHLGLISIPSLQHLGLETLTSRLGLGIIRLIYNPVSHTHWQFVFWKQCAYKNRDFKNCDACHIYSMSKFWADFNVELKT